MGTLEYAERKFEHNLYIKEHANICLVKLALNVIDRKIYLIEMFFWKELILII